MRWVFSCRKLSERLLHFLRIMTNSSKCTSDAKLQQVTQVKNSRKTGPQLDLERRVLSRRLIPRTVFAHEWQSFSAVLQHRKIFYFSFICSKCPHSWLDRNLRIGWNGNITGCPNKISLCDERKNRWRIFNSSGLEWVQLSTKIPSWSNDRSSSTQFVQ